MSARRDLDELFARKRAFVSLEARDPALSARLRELRSWQGARLARTYADLREDPRYARAVAFFLSDLYAPHDFTLRDRQLEQAAASLNRALPQALLDILSAALELEVLSVELDHAMVPQLGSTAVQESSYAAAYRTLGRRADRARQIDLTVSIGSQLERVVRLRWLGLALRAAHVPAHLAGLAELQDFLERGWAAFRSLPSPARLLEIIRARETELMNTLLRG